MPFHMNCIFRRCILACLFFSMAFAAVAQQLSDEQIAQDIHTQMEKGNRSAAIALATQLIERHPKSAQGYFARGRVYEESREHEKAIADYTQALKFEPRNPQLYQQRGSEYF